jgi:uncharacterized protein (DUF58 family)
VGAVALAAIVFYYGATSEVAWLFLLAYWVLALVVASYVYALWNWRRIRGAIGVRGVTPGPDSPVEHLSELLLRSAPMPAPCFEGDQLRVELGLFTSGAARGPALFGGAVAGSLLSTATGVVPRAGWREERLVGPVRRGPVRASVWVLEAGDLLGLFRKRRRSSGGEIALVLPLFTSLHARPQTREVEASLAAPRSGAGTELFGVREYRPGDPLRRIHWRSSARHGELIVREYEPPGVQALGIFCDPEPSSQEAADQIARLAASEAWDCIRAGGRVVLWSPGTEPSRPDESRSLWALLEWLARYPQVAPEDGSEAPRVGDAVGLFGGGGAQIAAALEDARRRGGSVRAWAIGAEEPELDAPVRKVGTTWPL